MLKLRIMKWNGKCRKHPGFDPGKEGRHAIRGNCEACHTLCDLHDLAGKLRGAIAEARDKFPATRERKKKAPREYQYTIEELLHNQEGAQV